MGELRLPGLATGIDTGTLVQQLMLVEQQRLNSYQIDKQEYEQETSLLEGLRNKVLQLNTAVSVLSDADKLNAFKASTSDKDVLTINASSDASPGSHSIEIDQLATSETWIQQTSTFDYKTDYVGGGSFIYSYNNQERVITAIADETTLQDFVNLINNDEDNPGVTASLLYQGGKYHLMLTGQDTGGDYQISINSSSTEVWASSTEGGSFTRDGQNASLATKLVDLDEFTENAGLQGDEYITISGKNHFGIDLPDTQLDISQYTTIGHLVDSINEHYDGIATARYENGEIFLTDHISGSSGMEIGLAYNAGSGDTVLTLPLMAFSTEGGSSSESLASLTSSSFIETQDAQDSEIKVDGYPSSTTAEIQTLTLDSVASSGHFHLTYMGETTGEIAWNASTDDIKTALEALSTVSAGDITVGGTGLDQAGTTTFTFLSSAGDVEMISIDAASLTGPTSTSFEETTKGNDGWISRNSNSISDALLGITLNLQDVTSGNPVEITITRDKSSVSSKVNNLVNAYNDLTTYLTDLTEYDSEAEEMGPLYDYRGISFIKSQIRTPLIGIASGFDSLLDSFVQASDIGLSVNHIGEMELDEAELQEALNEDFMGVVNLLGAKALGKSDSNIIEFYASSGVFTTAGAYDVEATISGGIVTNAKIKLTSESEWRDITPDDGSGVLRGDSTFDDNGNPLYPENSLVLTVDTTVGDGTYTATVSVKQGIFGALDDALEEILKSDGNIDISIDNAQSRIRELEKKIISEEDRLEHVEERLVARFARLEKVLTEMQQQMSAVNMLTQAVFGSL
ncbi:MAG: flagellar filament capping protein FliD [Planctomycetota bacterium]|jgi:flagellar capping protein FliD